ncbi:hypothetical protein FN846DRAFT_780108 [Sphaerosporella brunnea]|uniref:G-protein coupled receptors family 2 profile 2 domain-containing protein n=1 Tax=Sphaerosporella brunnea TaxID=1250544 RepID=A0A5J5EV98_9PEZI|nr:hypothetical protein FN846DRAFT_780108 [Sphaerosporella brunnea]
MVGLTQWQSSIVETTSRISSGFSLVGASFIIITFCTSKNFHRPINRLAFYAAFGNIITNVATIYSMEGIRAGRGSRLCQAQAAIIQWAIPADALFCLAMAWNVYLTVFRKKTTKQLRVLEPLYVSLCYGIPMVPALTFLIIKEPGKNKIYGPATLWCWIGTDWQILRIATFYGPTWIVLVLTFGIYALAGRVIFQLRRNLRHFAKESSSSQGTQALTSHPTARQQEPVLIVPGKISVTTVDTVEMSVAQDANLEAQTHIKGPRPSSLFPGITHHSSPQIVPDIASYTCHIEAVPHRHSRVRLKANNALEANTAAWAYCRCAMLFFLALLITWLPSSINRVYDLASSGKTSFGLNFAAALVLPAQGFWNALIYTVTTYPACNNWFRDIWVQMKQPLVWCRNRWRRRFDSSLQHSQSLSSV